MPRPIRAIAAITLAIVAAGAGALIARDRLSPSEADLIIAECEAALLDRLAAPTTYKRISVTGPSRRAAVKREYLGWWTNEQMSESLALARRDPDYAEVLDIQRQMFDAHGADVIEIVLTYDAQNHFGTPLRLSSTCAGTVDTGAEFETFGPLGPAIDNYTTLQWATRP